MIIDYDFKHDTILKDVEGAVSKIRQLPPDKPNKGLGFHITADGNQNHEFSY